MSRLPGIRYSSPVQFSVKQRFQLAIIPPVVGCLAKAWFRTCHVEVRNREYLDSSVAKSGHVIVGFWHEYLGLALHHYRNSGNHTLTSYSFDGELAARLVEQFGLYAVRGSSSRGGTEALGGLNIALQHVPMVGITLDGPRGPRRVTKPGAAILAVRTQTPIIPHAFVAEPAWRLKSWDRFLIPKAFSRIISAYGPPIDPPIDSSHKAIRAMHEELQAAMTTLHTELEASLRVSQP